jgi:hypothetical protein
MKRVFFIYLLLLSFSLFDQDYQGLPDNSSLDNIVKISEATQGSEMRKFGSLEGIYVF